MVQDPGEGGSPKQIRRPPASRDSIAEDWQGVGLRWEPAIVQALETSLNRDAVRRLPDLDCFRVI